jgi:hypothetical protein
MTFLVGITSATLGNHVATYIVVVADKSPTNDSHFDEHDFLGVRGEICKFLQKYWRKKFCHILKKVTTGFRVCGLRVCGFRVSGFGLRVCGLRVFGFAGCGFSGFGLAGLRVSGCGLRVEGLNWFRRIDGLVYLFRVC